MKINPVVVLPMQQKVLTSKERFTILAVGAGAGATYVLYLKAIMAEQEHVSFVSPTYKISQVVFRDFCDTFAKQFNWRISALSQIITTEDGKKIKFTTHTNELRLRGLILVDSAHNFPEEWLEYYINKTECEMVFTSKPAECGWRTPVYKRGMLLRDTKGEVVYSEYSWDKYLVDCGSAEEWALIADGDYLSKVNQHMYKFGVEVVSGYGCEDNIFLMRSNPTYAKMLDSLAPKDKELLTGDWEV
jgi:hypothetical protein